MTDTFKLIVAGGRDYDDYLTLSDAITRYRDKQPNICIVSGNARGADTLGIRYAMEHGVPFEVYPADWQRYGKRAGSLRNITMGDIADGLLAFWDGRSSGTRHMITYMQSLGKPTDIVLYNQVCDVQNTHSIIQLEVF